MLFEKIIIMPNVSNRIDRRYNYWQGVCKESMNVHNFYNIIDSIRLYGKLSTVYFPHSDLNEWEYAQEALQYLKKHKIYSVVHTDNPGLLTNWSIFPDHLHINLYSYVKIPEMRESVEEGIRKFLFSMGNIKLTLHLPTREDVTFKDIACATALGDVFGTSVLFFRNSRKAIFPDNIRPIFLPNGKDIILSLKDREVFSLKAGLKDLKINMNKYLDTKRKSA